MDPLEVTGAAERRLALGAGARLVGDPGAAVRAAIGLDLGLGEQVGRQEGIRERSELGGNRMPSSRGHNSVCRSPRERLQEKVNARSDFS